MRALFLFLLVLLPAQAHALSRLGLGGSLSWSTLTSYEQASDAGIGFYPEFRASQNLPSFLEFGFEYMPRSFSSTFTTYTSNTLRVTMLYGMKLRAVSVGVGLFGSRAYREIGMKPNGASGSAASSNISYTAFGLKRDDVGYMASLMFRIPGRPSYFLALRYSRSLLNLATSSALERKFTDIQLLIGSNIYENKQSSIGF